MSIIVAAMACIGISAGCGTAAQKTSAPGNETGVATELVQCLVDGRFTDATAHFDAVMHQAMSADRLAQTWQAVIGQCGAVQRLGEPRTGREAGFVAVFVPCEFEKTTLDIKLIVGRDGRISGLWFVPHVDAGEAQYSPPAYVDKDRFEERAVTVGEGEWKLPGTLTVPKGAGPFPGLVLVHGSGPNDRDETLGANKPFRDLAEGLACRGIAVLRYDKRTMVYPARIAQAMDRMTVKDEVVDDAVAAIGVLRKTEKVDPKRIFVLGHSLGGALIPRIAQAAPEVAGVIAMAGPTRPLEDIVIDQFIYLASLDGPPSPEEEKQIDALRRQIDNVKSPKLSPSVAASSLPLGLPASYWLDLRGYRPAEAAKSLQQPILILQGGRDYQVTTVEYEGWRKALAGRPNVALKIYPNLNHLFMEGSGKSTPQEYDRRGPVPQAVIDDLAAWIGAH